MDIPKIVARRLLEIREAHGYTSEEIGKVVNRSQQSYSRYETGVSQLNYEQLYMLAKFYNVSIDYFFGLDTEKMSENVSAMSDDDLDKAIIDGYLNLNKKERMDFRNTLLKALSKLIGLTGLDKVLAENSDEDKPEKPKEIESNKTFSFRTVGRKDGEPTNITLTQKELDDIMNQPDEADY